MQVTGYPEFETCLSLTFFHIFYIEMIILNIYISTEIKVTVRPHLMGLVYKYMQRELFSKPISNFLKNEK